MAGWKNISIVNPITGDIDLASFEVELNRRLRQVFSSIDISQILFSLNDIDGTLSLSKGGTGSSLSAPAADRILFYDKSGNKVDWLELGSGLNITGTTIKAVLNAILLGTANQITVTDNGDGTYTLSTPQNIDTSADVEFDSVKLDDLTASRMVSTDANKKLVSISSLSSWIAGTTNQIEITDDGDGTITIKFPSVLKIGNVADGNYTEIEADGTMKFIGNATVWRDENFSASTTAIGGSAPSLINWDTTSIKIPSFPNNSTKELNLLKEFDHAGKSGSTITFHAHVYPTTAGSGTIKFYIEYYLKNDGEPAVTGTASASVNTNSTAWEELRLDLTTVTDALVRTGTQIGARLYRLSTDPGTYTGDVAVSTWGYHYEIDTGGSRQITTK